MTDPWADVRERHQKDAEAFAEKRLAPKDDPLQRVLDMDRVLTDADALLAVVRRIEKAYSLDYIYQLIAALPEHLKGDVHDK